MWELFHIEQHQRELREEAERYRLVNRKEEYDPNKAIQRIKCHKRSR